MVDGERTEGGSRSPQIHGRVGRRDRPIVAPSTISIAQVQRGVGRSDHAAIAASIAQLEGRTDDRHRPAVGPKVTAQVERGARGDSDRPAVGPELVLKNGYPTCGGYSPLVVEVSVNNELASPLISVADYIAEIHDGSCAEVYRTSVAVDRHALSNGQGVPDAVAIEPGAVPSIAIDQHLPAAVKRLIRISAENKFAVGAGLRADAYDAVEHQTVENSQPRVIRHENWRIQRHPIQCPARLYGYDCWVIRAGDRAALDRSARHADEASRGDGHGAGEAQSAAV